MSQGFHSLQKLILDHLNGKTAWTMPTGFQVALLKGEPNPDGSDLATLEVTVGEYGEYVRQTMTPAEWDAAIVDSQDNSRHMADNNAEVAFPVMATGTGATVTHYAVTDQTGTGLLFYGPVTPNVVLQNGVEPKFPAAGLKTTQD